MKKSKRLTAELRLVRERGRFFLVPIFTDYDGAVTLPDTAYAILSADSRRGLTADPRAVIGGARKAIDRPTLKF
jgi:hypothetical protein